MKKMISIDNNIAEFMVDDMSTVSQEDLDTGLIEVEDTFGIDGFPGTYTQGEAEYVLQDLIEKVFFDESEYSFTGEELEEVLTDITENFSLIVHF